MGKHFAKRETASNHLAGSEIHLSQCRENVSIEKTIDGQIENGFQRENLRPESEIAEQFHTSPILTKEEFRGNHCRVIRRTLR